MTAVLTNYLVDRVRAPSPFVIKYIPYGGLAEVRDSRHNAIRRRPNLLLLLALSRW